MSKVTEFAYALPKQNLTKGAGAEDDSWRRIVLANRNKILFVVAIAESYHIYVLKVCFKSLAYDVMAENFSYHFFSALSINIK